MTFWRRGRRDDELADEIENHLALAEAEYRRRGMSAHDARDAARRAFGGVLKARQLYHEQRGWRWLDAFVQDVRFGVRVLRRDLGFAITAIVVLGLGIGINNLMFTLLYGSALRGLPIDRADRVLYISAFDKRFPDRPLSLQDFDDLRRETRSFGEPGDRDLCCAVRPPSPMLAAFIGSPFSVADEGRAPDRFEGAHVTAGAFEVLGIRTVLGRTFAAADDTSGAAPVVLLSRQAWQSRYGGDTTVLGRSIIVNGTPATVIGVIPDRSGFPSTAEIWLPLAHLPNLAAQRRENRTLRVFGRLRDDVTADDARLEVAAIVAGIARVHPDSSDGLEARVVPINDRFFGGLSSPAWLPFITASILIVLVSCANAANLMIGRGVLRAREIAIRGSLGASRARVICQFLVEAIVLATAGGVVALAISLGAARVFAAAIPAQTLPYWLHYGMDWRIFAVLVAVALATVLIFGFIPAVQASRVDVTRTLRDGGRGSIGRRGHRRLTSAFLVAEFALSVVLLAQLVVSYQAQQPLVPSDRAVDSAALLAATVTLPPAKYGAPSDRLTFYDAVRERIASAPGVSSVTIASQPPFGGGSERRLDIDGRADGSGERAPSVMTVMIAPKYFATLDVALRQGREFSDQDGRPGQQVAIVNDRFAQRYFGNTDAVGKLIRVTAPNASADDTTWLTVIGVAGNIRQRNLPDVDPVVYLPLASGPLQTATLLIRSDRNAADIAQRVRDEVAGIDPHLPLYRVMTMKQAIEDARWNGRASHNLILTITIVSLALSMVGLYAVTAYMVGQRTQEIGVRVALGARPRQVQLLILSRAAVQVAVGFVLGLAGSALWDSAFMSGRVGLRILSLPVLGPVVLFLGLLTFAACVIPVRRATRLDPVTALRHD